MPTSCEAPATGGPEVTLQVRVVRGRGPAPPCSLPPRPQGVLQDATCETQPLAVAASQPSPEVLGPDGFVSTRLHPAVLHSYHFPLPRGGVARLIVAGWTRGRPLPLTHRHHSFLGGECPRIRRTRSPRSGGRGTMASKTIRRCGGGSWGRRITVCAAQTLAGARLFILPSSRGGAPRQHAPTPETPTCSRENID